MPLLRPTHLLNFFNKPLARDKLIYKPVTSFRRTMAQEFKVKDLTSISLKDGEMQQYDLEGIENGKVLLARCGETKYAVSSSCTHYGAPLKNGVLSPNGTVRCPWHGACFSITTGDVEDGPGLDHLNKYEIIEKADGVYIKGNEAAIKANRRKVTIKCQASNEEPIVVVGGGSGTAGFVQSLRENGSTTPVAVFTKEPYLPINRTALSKGMVSDASKILLRSQDWYNEGSISVVQDEVTSIDFDGKKVVTASGKSHPYSRLLLATGSTPKNLPLPGFKELGNIFVLRTVPDVQRILEAIGESKGKNIIVVGSGFIGLELSNALAKDNQVTVVDMIDIPLKSVLGKEVGTGIQQMFEAKNVKFYMNAGVEKAAPSATDSSKVGAVHLKDGSALEADLVIVGVGAGPSTEFLRNNKSVNLEKDGSLKVDEQYRVSGVKDVFAIGDIATFPYAGPTSNGAYTRIEHWNVAQNHGLSVGAYFTNPGARPKQHIPIFWSALGAQLRYCGNMPHGWDDVFVDGSPAEAKFAAYYCKGDTVGAVATMGRDPIMSKAVDLMERGKMPSKQELQGGADVLAM